VAPEGHRPTRQLISREVRAVRSASIIRNRDAVNFVKTLLQGSKIIKMIHLLFSPRRRKLRIQEFARFWVQCRHPLAFCFINFYLCLGNSITYYVHSTISFDFYIELNVQKNVFFQTLEESKRTCSQKTTTCRKYKRITF
jgi:hypothetical protein